MQMTHQKALLTVCRLHSSASIWNPCELLICYLQNYSRLKWMWGTKSTCTIKPYFIHVCSICSSLKHPLQMSVDFFYFIFFTKTGHCFIIAVYTHRLNLSQNKLDSKPVAAGCGLWLDPQAAVWLWHFKPVQTALEHERASSTAMALLSSSESQSSPVISKLCH